MKTRVYKIVICLVLGALLGLSRVGRDFIASPSVTLFIKAAVLAVVPFGVGSYALFTLLERFAARHEVQTSRLSAIIDKVLAGRRHSFCIVALVLFALWVPILLLMAPFSTGPDTIAQLLWFNGEPAFDPSAKFLLPGATMSDHHPFLDTYLYGLFYRLGEGLFADPAMGMFVLVIVQSIVTALACAYVVRWMRLRGVPVSMCVASFAFFAFCPVIPVWLSSIVKDITGIAPLMLWFLCTLDVALFSLYRSDRVKTSTVLGLVGFGTIAILTRKSSLIVVGSGSVVLILFCGIRLLFDHVRQRQSSESKRGKGVARWTLAAVTVSSVLSVAIPAVIVPAIAFPLLRIAPGGPQESMAIPVQQVAAILIEHPDGVADAEKAAIDWVIPVDKVSGAYTHITADPIKDLWKRQSATAADRNTFLKTWVTLVARYPISALKGTKYIAGLFTWGLMMGDAPSVVWWGWPEHDSARLFPRYPEMTRTDGQAFVNNVLSSVHNSQIPLLADLIDVSTYTFVVPLLSISYCFWTKRYGQLPVYLLGFCLLLPCLLVPAALSRYAIPMLFCAPLVCSAPFLRGKRCPAPVENGVLS